MVITNGRLFGLSLDRVWFWAGEEICSKAQLIRYLRLNENEVKAIAQIESKAMIDFADTLVSNISVNEDEIQSSFNKNYRYEIRRAEKEANKIEFFKSKDLAEATDVLEDFYQVYYSFCESLGNKRLAKDLSKKKIRSYIDAGCILLSRSVNEEYGVKVYHLYVYDSNTAVLCYSASDFREESVDRAFAGRANKQLHWEDMKLFKTEGLSIYDWGNVSNGDEAQYNGIDRFKAGFGGQPVTVTNIFVGNRLFGKVLVTIGKKLRK